MLKVKFEQKGIEMMLSPKEIEVLALVALGYSDKEIMKKLKMSYGTVRTRIDKTILKLGAKNRVNAVLIYKSKHIDWLEGHYEKINNSLDCRKVRTK